MSTLQSYKVEIYPYCHGLNTYEVTAYINDEQVVHRTTVVEQLPYEAELEVLNRISSDLIYQMKKSGQHKYCCNCCGVKKKCQKS